MAIGPERTMAGRMKLQSGGTSTTLHSIERRSASSKTAMLTSVFEVAAIARKWPSRSPGANGRSVHSRSPAATSARMLVARLGCDHVHLGVAGQKALDLLEPDVARADDQAAAAR